MLLIGGQDEIERAVEVDRKPPSGGEVGHRVTSLLVEPAGEGVVGGDIGDRSQDLVRARERDDVGGISVVGERLAVLGAGREDERATVAVGRERDGP